MGNGGVEASLVLLKSSASWQQKPGWNISVESGNVWFDYLTGAMLCATHGDTMELLEEEGVFKCIQCALKVVAKTA